MNNLLILVLILLASFFSTFFFMYLKLGQEKLDLEYLELLKQCQGLAMDRQRQAAAIVRSWLNQQTNKEG